jgi:hypothetical protein
MTRILPAALVTLIVAVSCVGVSLGAGAQPASSTAATPDSAGADATEAVRVYLSQSLVALRWAHHYAGTAARVGTPDTFDLDRYLAELDTIAHGLERYLRPEGPPPGPLTPVEITGEFLRDGLRGQTPPLDAESRP